MVEHIEVRVAEGAVCDFCSSEDPLFTEHAEDFDTPITPNATGHSEGGWSSCQACHDLVQGHRWHALERRATDLLAAKHPDIPRSRIAAGVKHMHMQFRNHRGPNADSGEGA